MKGETSRDRRQLTVYGDGSPFGGRTLAVLYERVVDPRDSAQTSEQEKYRVWWDGGTMHVVYAQGLTDVALDQAVADLGPLSPDARRALPPC